MNAVPFDILKFARKLEASGMSAGTAAGTTEALAEAMSGAELATKSDLTELQTDLQANIAELRTELKADIAELKTELKADIVSFNARIDLLSRDMTIRLGGMMIIGCGVLLTAMRYLLVRP